jgi:flotillin
MLSTILPFIPFAVIAIVVIAILCSGYIKAPPDMAYIISGLHKKPRILIGKAGIKIPFFERVDKLSLGAIQIDVKTGSAVPTAEYINVRVDSTVSVRVGRTDEMIALAAQNFLNVGREEIARKINDLLEGNIREIVGQMKLTEMIGDRKSFSEKVQENAVPDLARYGLELITFNVQNFVDDNDVIQNLGIDNVAQISKNAAIARSNAEREVEVAKAANAKQANDAKVQAAEEIAKRNNDLAIKQANLQREADTEKARAEAAKSIEAENQRKLKDVAETEANIAKAQKQAELKQKEIELKEYELTALVRKQADADKYAQEKAAEAALAKAQRQIDAERYEQEQKAEAKKVAAQHEAEAKKAAADAMKYAALAEAEAIKAKGEAEAEAIRLKGEAEAIGIEKKAEAQKKMGEASVVEMIMKALPEMTAAAAAPLANVDNITMYGSDNSTKLVREVTGITNQVMAGLKENGIDIYDIISKALGNKS